MSPDGPSQIIGVLTQSVWLFFVAVVAVVILLAVRSGRRRRTALQEYAAARGWDYQGSAQGLAGRFTSEPFNAGRSRRATDALTGDFHGRHAASFDYQYVTGGGKDSTTHYFHVVCLHLPTALPRLRFDPDGLGASLATFFGGEDIQFESEEFNRAWRVRSDGPPQYAYDFVHPRMMETMMHQGIVGHSITVEGEDIYLYARGRQRIDRIDPRLAVLSSIVDQIPRHLWLKAGHDPDAA